MALGPDNFQIEEGPIYYVDGVEVPPGYSVDVDPAVTHTIGAKYKVRNNGAWPHHYWRCCLTVHDVTNGAAKGYAFDTGQGIISDWKERHINVGYIDKDITFRVKVWANQDHTLTTPPPEGEW